MTSDEWEQHYEEEWDEEERPCDYGFDTPCVEPALRDMGNCFECWLMQEENKLREKHCLKPVAKIEVKKEKQKK